MRGELIGVWSETWREIWLPLIEQPLAEDDEGLPEDIFCELYRALEPALSPRPSVETSPTSSATLHRAVKHSRRPLRTTSPVNVSLSISSRRRMTRWKSWEATN